jgi:hypothetical protein
MDEYPEVLLPRQSNLLLSEDEVSKYNFVRETLENMYVFLAQNIPLKELIPKIIAPQLSEREVFELSVFLYGYYDESHVGIRVSDDSLYALWTPELSDIPACSIKYSQRTAFPLYLSAEKLHKKPVDFNDKLLFFSFSHKPTRANYWHFQFYTKDSEGNCIPRDKSNRHLKRLAKHILEQYVMKAICPKSEVKKFHFHIQEFLAGNAL